MKLQNLKKGGTAKGGRHDKIVKGDGMGTGLNIQTSQGTPVGEIEVGEVVINRQASAQHCEDLSKINQSAGGGVAIDCAATRQTIAQTALPMEVINAPQSPEQIMAAGGMPQVPIVVDLNDVWSIIFWSIEKPV